MKKSLFAGAAALALIAGAAIAQQSYDSTTTRTTTVAPVAVVPVAPPAQTTTTVQQTVNPQVFNPTASYREDHVTTQDGQVVERTTRSDTTSPQGRTTTYSQTTTGSGDQ